MPSRYNYRYKVTAMVYSRLQNIGFTHCIHCSIKIKIGDWVRRTMGNIYHDKCLKRI